MDDPPVKRTCLEELQSFLAEQPCTKEKELGPTGLLNAIKREMTHYEATGTRPHLLEKVYTALLSIPATSTGN